MRQEKLIARSGFTLIELLVVLSVVIILIGLLLPAVQTARESSRRAQCANNLRQIGIAIQSYDSSVGSIPQGRNSSRDPRFVSRAGPCSSLVNHSFLLSILPHVEQHNAFNSANFAVSILGPENATVRSISINTYACPSDAGAGVGREASLLGVLPGPTPDLSSVMRTSYSGMMGAVYSDARPNPLYDCRIDARQLAMASGVINDIAPMRTASITDGLSNTIMVAERKSSILIDVSDVMESNASLHYAWWFIGDVGHTVLAATSPPNNDKQFPSANLGDVFSSASSSHPSGVNALLADGSVRFIRDSIQSWRTEYETVNGSTKLSRPGVWQYLATRNGSEIIAADSY